MANLPTNFKDDILDTSVNTRRRYRVYENTDGTIELEDVTEYSQVGDEFGSGQINAINTEVNKKLDKNMIVRDLDTINAIAKEGYVPDALALKEGLSEINDSLGGLKFGTDGEGNYGYFGDDDVLIPFKSGTNGYIIWLSGSGHINGCGITLIDGSITDVTSIPYASWDYGLAKCVLTGGTYTVTVTEKCKVNGVVTEADTVLVSGIYTHNGCWLIEEI